MNEPFQIRVPQMGEGLQYAKVVRLLKQPGDWVEEDCDVIEVETEKAVLGISTPVSGFVSAVSCQPGDTVDVGAVLLEVGREKPQAAPAAIGSNQERRRDRIASVRKTAPPAAGETLPDRQLALIRNMRASQDIVIAASIESRIDWERIDNIKRAFRSRQEVMGVPSSLGIVCWAVSRAMQEFGKFRSRLDRDDIMTTTVESRIGIAIAGEEDTLDMRIISATAADSFREMQAKFRKALAPEDGAGGEVGYHSLAISDMSSFQVHSARPVIVYPAVATLFIGAPYWITAGKSGAASRCSNFVLAFDHRLINGAYAARFMRQVDAGIQALAKQTGLAREEGEEHAQAIIKYGT